jgi:hypothetical protein
MPCFDTERSHQGSRCNELMLSREGASKHCFGALSLAASLDAVGQHLRRKRLGVVGDGMVEG